MKLILCLLFSVFALAQDNCPVDPNQPLPKNSLPPNLICPPQPPSEPMKVPVPKSGASKADTEPKTNNDLFIMLGSDFDRPGLLPRANYNIGWGHAYDFLTNSRFGKALGDEITFSYTWENVGSRGFWHSPGFDASTESVGLMKNFTVPMPEFFGYHFYDMHDGKDQKAPISAPKRLSVYTWPQIGVTSAASNGSPVQNRLYSGFAVGFIVHLPRNTSIWVQEAYNKVVTVPWYTTSSIGYTISWK